MTPDELAAELGVSPRSVRAWLRRTNSRSLLEKHQRWHLSAREVDAARAHFAAPAQRDTVDMSHALAESPESAITAVTVERFCSAPMHTRSDVLARPPLVPVEPGVYGWWFRRLPTEIDTSRCLVRDGHTLLYTGISPRRPPTNDRPPSRQTLRDRIGYHYTGNAEGSTLRKTLGALLAHELGIELRRVGSGNRMTFVDGEQVLSMWMAENARVSWIVDAAPWVLEEHLISTLDVPLNLDGNKHNAFHPHLTAMRAASVARAKELPVVANPGVGGR